MSLLRGVSFDHLKKKSRPLVLAGVYVRSELEVAFEMQYPGEDQRWLNAVRKAEAAFTPKTTEREKFDALLSVFVECAVVGWKNVIGEDEQPVAYYVAGAVEIMNAYVAVAEDLALRTMNFALAQGNFRDYSPPKLDAESLGKK